jgi:hypothetical protein
MRPCVLPSAGSRRTAAAGSAALVMAAGCGWGLAPRLAEYR